MILCWVLCASYLSTTSLSHVGLMIGLAGVVVVVTGIIVFIHCRYHHRRFRCLIAEIVSTETNETTLLLHIFIPQAILHESVCSCLGEVQFWRRWRAQWGKLRNACKRHSTQWRSRNNLHKQSIPRCTCIIHITWIFRCLLRISYTYVFLYVYISKYTYMYICICTYIYAKMPRVVLRRS